MHAYDESAFRARVDAALRQIRAVLDNTRNPQYPADVPHRYDDKYLLAETVTRVAAASLVQCLEVIGMTPAQLEQMRGWARSRSVTIRLVAQEDCRFLREEKRQVESANQLVTETRGLLGGKVTRTDKVVTTITEYFWSFEAEHELVAFQGTAVDQRITLHARTGKVELKTTTDKTPRPKTVVKPSLDVDVTWLLLHLDDEGRAAFAIDRDDAGCHTPRRNGDVEAALRCLDEVAAWCERVATYFVHELFPVQQEHGLDLKAIDDGEVFVPVLPLFEGDAPRPDGTDGDDGANGVLPGAYAHAFLAEEKRTLTEKGRALAMVFPRDESLITAVDAMLVVTLLHARTVCWQHADCVAHIEEMMRAQLVAAIGKELTPADFTAYMEFHHRKLVRPAYRPLPFSYAIRRPEHTPEGVLAIESTRGGASSDAISTTVRRTEARRPMYFGLDASTRVAFLGERYLHAWISHQFSGQRTPALSLVARARQFSSFILLVGRIASADTFEPRLGVILQNKDLVKIPLLLEQIPTPKEFRDAIESLSPEQQRFARAFRGMQLESTLFGVCIIQIKPQLEKLLRLPPDSLTKEIKLTQDLLDLFIQYQIPSDLLSYDGDDEAHVDEKLARVREYVGRMREMIDVSKARELEEEREREAMRLAEMNRSYAEAPPPAMMPSAPPSFGAPGGGYRGGPPAMPAMAGPPPMPTGAPPPPSSGATMRLSSPAPMVPAPVVGPPQPVPATSQAAQPAQPTVRPSESPAATSTSSAQAGGDGDVTDYTRIPAQLDRKFEALDTDGALRATIINPGDPWSRSRQKGLLSDPTTSTLAAADQRTEKNKAFDLLDALSKSGALPIDDASLHVVMAATHCFDRTLLDTVIQDNVNPIEKVERSLMIVGTTVHDRAAAELVAPDQHDRFFTTTPQLADAGSGPAPRPALDGARDGGDPPA